MFKTIFLAVALMFVAVPAFAQQQSTPENVSQELNREIALMTDAEKRELLTSVKDGTSSGKVKEWVEIGEGIGAGLVATAERLGVAVNDFANTPVGKLAIVLIVWSYLGSQLVGLTLGVSLLTLGNLIWYHMLKKVFGEFNDKGKFVKFDTGLFRHHDGLTGMFVVTCMAMNVIGIIAVLTA